MRSFKNGSFKYIWSLPQFRYLVIGGINTFLSYGLGALLLYALLDKIHYFWIMVIGTIASVTISYLNHKFIVFRTEGNYIREYLRFYLIYAVPICFAFIAFPICYDLLGMNPYFAQAVIMGVTIVASYIGHKRFSFHPRRDIASTKAPPGSTD
jgi:putative flippase GtrA